MTQFPPPQMWPGADSPMPGYDIVELSWEVIPAPGQPALVLNGTVEQVHSQLLEINPKYQIEVFEKREGLLAAPTAATAATAATDPTEPTAIAHSAQIWHMTCGGYTSANTKRIKDGIKYLNSIAGQPKNGPGPNNCGRVSCSYNSSIWWCNDVCFLFPCNDLVAKVHVLLTLAIERCPRSTSWILYHCNRCLEDCQRLLRGK